MTEAVRAAYVDALENAIEPALKALLEGQGLPAVNSEGLRTACLALVALRLADLETYGEALTVGLATVAKCAASGTI